MHIYRPHLCRSARILIGRYALLLMHLLLLPLLQVVTEGNVRAEFIAIIAEQLVFIGAAVSLGGRRLLWFSWPLLLPGLMAGGFTLCYGQTPDNHFWLWSVARAVSFIVPIMTISLLILVDVLAAEEIVFDLICGALCVFVLLGMCWANLYLLLERLAPGSFVVDFSRYHIDQTKDPLAAIGVFTYYSFVTLTTVGYGDIVPASATARWLVWVQAVFGQFYMAVFVSRLIGLQTTTRSSLISGRSPMDAGAPSSPSLGAPDVEDAPARTAA